MHTTNAKGDPFDHAAGEAKDLEADGTSGGFADVKVWSDGESGDEAHTYIAIEFQQGADLRLDGEKTDRAHRVELMFFGSIERAELARAMAALSKALGV